MRTRRLLCGLALALAGSLPLLAQIVPNGDELAAVPATGGQHHPTVSVHAQGALVAWEDETRGIVARRLDRGYHGLGSAVVLAANDPLPPLPFVAVLREEHDAAVAARPDGTFLAAWTHQTVHRSVDIFYDSKYVISSRVVARLFDADGTPASSLFVLSADAAYAQLPRVVATTGSTFLVTWQERGGDAPGIHLVRFDRRGRPGDDTLVGSRGLRPAIAQGGQSVLVSWEKCCGSSGYSQVFARMFDLDGKPTSRVVRIADDGPRGARAASVAGQPSGEFLVAYQRGTANNSYETRIFGQLVSQRANLVGGELALSPGRGDAENAPAAAALADGGWVVGWMVWHGGFRVAADAGTFTRAGNLVAAPVDLNQGVIVGGDLAIASGPQGRLLSAWEGFDANEHRGIRARAAWGPRQ